MVAVIEDKQRAQFLGFKRSQQPVVSGEIIFSWPLLHSAPGKIHAHPVETRYRQHFEFAGSRIGEVDVYPESIRHNR